MINKKVKIINIEKQNEQLAKICKDYFSKRFKIEVKLDKEYDDASESLNCAIQKIS